MISAITDIAKIRSSQHLPKIALIQPGRELMTAFREVEIRCVCVGGQEEGGVFKIENAHVKELGSKQIHT